MTATPNHALQRTAPCVTAPASAAAFPPTVQVPRRTPLSLSLRSVRPFPMSVMIETTIAAEAVSSLLKAWTDLRAAKQKEELETPEWQLLEKEYYTHLRWRFRYQQRVFRQQQIAAWIITALVLILVLSGLCFSFLQLRYALAVGDFSSLASAVQVKTAGKVSISSSIVGASTLALSLIFFSLYLKHVFQIAHPVPPHISLSETDAHKLRPKGRDRVSTSSPFDDEQLVITRVTQG